ncbi:MAG TPA: hypothetical protein VL171_05370 [Verrucomicrobiae bacterium]|nr:hypothetical protein [Verrucomicrobiae bacterium]
MAGSQNNKSNAPTAKCPHRIVHQTLNATADANAIQPPMSSHRQATTNATAKNIASGDDKGAKKGLPTILSRMGMKAPAASKKVMAINGKLHRRAVQRTNSPTP